MTARRVQRVIGLGSCVIVTALLLVWVWALGSTLSGAAVPTGWMLGGACGLLALYNVRKKLPFLPAGASAAWLQVHVCVGFVTIPLYLVHAGMAWPTGWLEVIVAVLFALVTLTGLLGLALSRSEPPRLAERGESVSLERVPVVRRQLHDRAEAIALASAEGSVSPVLAEFYRDRLASFFAGPRHFVRHALRIRTGPHALLTELSTLARFLDAEDATRLPALAELVREKDALDRRWTAYTLLRGWLFAHIPLGYALVAVMIVHGVVSLAFSMAGGGGH